MQSVTQGMVFNCVQMTMLISKGYHVSYVSAILVYTYNALKLYIYCLLTSRYISVSVNDTRWLYLT